jgi:transposase
MFKTISAKMFQKYFGESISAAADSQNRFQWAGRKPSTPNLRNGSPAKIGAWKAAAAAPESGSPARPGAKYTEAEMQQALVRTILPFLD